ncbi:hypothetical protein [Novosphingobium sp. M1R2S20]|uniref:Uncharacterized protein n=1 Tax=Novosphingobium rhizovicinum TaxID=3228928 RepID=A0ABV3RFY0_9SPHN
MKKLVIAALLVTGVAGPSAFAQGRYDVFATWSECRAAAKLAAQAGETVSDCRKVDGGWTYNPRSCQDGQCMPD